MAEPDSHIRHTTEWQRAAKNRWSKKQTANQPRRSECFSGKLWIGDECKLELCWVQHGRCRAARLLWAQAPCECHTKYETAGSKVPYLTVSCLLTGPCTHTAWCSTNGLAHQYLSHDMSWRGAWLAFLPGCNLRLIQQHQHSQHLRSNNWQIKWTGTSASLRGRLLNDSNISRGAVRTSGM